jgi:hypothetical protein
MAECLDYVDASLDSWDEKDLVVLGETDAITASFVGALAYKVRIASMVTSA